MLSVLWMQLYVFFFFVVLRGSHSQEHFLPCPADVVKLPRQEAITGKACRALQRHSLVFARVSGQQQSTLEEWKSDVLTLFMRQLCSSSCEHSSWVLFEWLVTYCSYILKVENGPNPLPGILEALAELTKWVVRKDPNSPNWSPEHLTCPLSQTYIYRHLAAVPGAPRSMAGGIITWHDLPEANK